MIEIIDVNWQPLTIVLTQEHITSLVALRRLQENVLSTFVIGILQSRKQFYAPFYLWFLNPGFYILNVRVTDS